MISYTNDNIFSMNVEAIVNTVNTVGVMGKGLALEFKKRYPSNYNSYYKACKENNVKVGKMFITQTSKTTMPKYIINFPTKQHWKNPSKLEWIESGLENLVKFIKYKNIKSIAIPQLGCANGGLQWSEVKLVIEEKLKDLNDVDIKIIVYDIKNIKFDNMKVIIAGSRDCTDMKILLEAIDESKFNISEVISGGARGADALGETWAKNNNIPLKIFPADWNIGKSAGYIRNKQMAEYGNALIALWNGESKGTNHMIEIAKNLNLKVYVKKYTTN